MCMYVVKEGGKREWRMRDERWMVKRKEERTQKLTKINNMTKDNSSSFVMC